MRNEFTEGEEAKYREAMWERAYQKEQQLKEDAESCLDAGGDDEDTD